MQLYVDLINLDRFLSTLDEELREINRLEGIWEKQRALFVGVPIEEERMLERSRYLKRERERIQGRKNYLLKAQELLPRATEENKANLENMLQRLRQLN